VIIEVNDAADERLNAFRWRERQLNTIAQRKAAQANNLESNGMFVAEGDLVVRRALEAGCKPSVVLCDPKCANEFAADVSKQGGITLSASADIRREVTGLGVPLDAIGVFHRPALRDAQSLIDSSTRLVILEAMLALLPVVPAHSDGMQCCSTRLRQIHSPAERCVFRWARHSISPTPESLISRPH
jgi:hypothetical protein